MRTIEIVKKDQDDVCYQLGYHVAMVEQYKAKMFTLAKEAYALEAKLKEEEKKDEPE